MAPLSLKEKENQKAAREKKCPHCHKPYEFSHMTDYLFRLRGNSIMCHYCIKEGYLVDPKSAIYTVFWFLTAIFSVIICLGGAFFVTATSYDETTGSYRVFWIVWIAAFFATGAIFRFITRAVKWKLGTISHNKRDKDYGEIR